MKPDESGHRPKTTYEKGTPPETVIDYGPDNLYVKLDTWGPKELLFSTLYCQTDATWGEEPARPINDCDMTTRQVERVELLFAGKSLPQPLEMISFAFTIDGVSRACTHQLVRTRIGASFLQESGRCNDWRKRPFRYPETVERAQKVYDGGLLDHPDGLEHCLYEGVRIAEYLQKHAQHIPNEGITMENAIHDYLSRGKELFSALVDSGIPVQDARRFLPIGTETYLHANYNFPALKTMLSLRLEHVCDWEINCVAQLMLREIYINCPRVMARNLGSASDLAGKAVFTKIEGWCPDQKYHYEYDQEDYEHTPEQNPFFVLSNNAMEGGPIQWIRTNGVHPNQAMRNAQSQSEEC